MGHAQNIANAMMLEQATNKKTELVVTVGDQNPLRRPVEGQTSASL
jgi:hypothetical protein